MSSSLTRWEQRVPEEAHLFNPAFCATLIVEFTKEYQKARKGDCPIVLPFCALPISLHPRTRKLLPTTTLTSMYTWLERNSTVLVGYRDRAQSFRPVLQEAIRFGVDRRALIISPSGELSIGPLKITFSAKFREDLTPDAGDCIAATRLLGRWLAKAGTSSTILSAWGIRP